MPYYRPRMLARLSVPVWGAPQDRVAQAANDAVTDFEVQVSRAELLRNDHNQADELLIRVDWRDAGVDPRLLSNAILDFSMGTADDKGEWDPAKNRVFLGIVTDVERSCDDSSRSVELQALDFTTLFLESKPYPPEGIPDYSQTLVEAWHRIVDHAGGKDVEGNWFRSAEFLRDKLQPRGVENWPPSLSTVAPGRLKKLSAPVVVKPDSDAWGVWQQTCGLLGLISWVDADKVIVAPSTNYYTRTNPVRFIWGKNILSMRERRNCAVAGRKLSLVSYDPLRGVLLQSWFPPRGLGTKKLKANGTAGKADDYEVFEFHGVSDQAALDAVCQRAYQERSRQELEGTITTSEFFVEGLTGGSANLLQLGAGQDIAIELEQETLDGLAEMPAYGKRVAYLKARGYRDSVAQILAKNQEALSRLQPVFHTRQVRTSLEVTEDGGSFEVEITYVNRIEVSGDSAT